MYYVSWDEVQEFIRRLNQQEKAVGIATVYPQKQSGNTCSKSRELQTAVPALEIMMQA